MKTKYTRSSLLFLIAYAMWITIALLKYSQIKFIFPKKLPINDVLLYTQWVVYILLILKFLDDKRYRLRNFAGLAVVFFCGYIEYSVQDKTVFLFMLCIFIFSSSNVDFDDILKVALVVETLVFVLTVSFSLIGIIPNHVWDEVRQRYDMGFTYCTFGSHFMLFITMIYSCVRKKITLLETVALAAVNFLLYWCNDTRTDLCIIILYLLCVYIWTHFLGDVKTNLVTKILFQYSGAIIAIAAVAAHMFYNPDIMLYSKMNALLSNRLFLGKYAIQEYGFTLFGQHIKWVGQGSMKKDPLLFYNYVDCSYLKYALNFGIIFSLLLLMGLLYLGKKVLEDGDKALCVSLLFLYVFSMIDAELCVLAFHPFLLKIGGFLNPAPEKMLKEKPERVIHLDDMISSMMRQWKKLSIGVVVVGIIFGSIGIANVAGEEVSISQKIFEAGIYGIKRIILFIILFIGFYTMKYMWSPRLICARDLWDMYGIKVFSVLSTGSDEELSVIADQIMMEIDDTDRTIILTGSDKAQLESMNLHILIKTLEEKATVRLITEIEDTDAIRKMEACNNIILIESVGESRYSKIEDITERIKVMDKSVMGSLVMKAV